MSIFRSLQPRIGFGWATRVIGFIALGTLLVSLAVLRPRPVHRPPRNVMDMKVYRDPPFVLFIAGLFFAFMGAFIPFFEIQPFDSTHTTASPELAYYAIVIINASATMGRLIPNFLADHVGALNVTVPCSIISAIIAFTWISVNDTRTYSFILRPQFDAYLIFPPSKPSSSHSRYSTGSLLGPLYPFHQPPS
jgi:predicted MFS family arabinose efflux permease